MADDDLAMRRMQKLILDRLKDDKNPVIAEMAKEIAAGRLTPREALSIDAYSEAVFKAGRETFSKVAAMPEEEREELAEQARQAVEDLPDEESQAQDDKDDKGDWQAIPAPSTEAATRRPRRPPRPEIEDDEPSGSIMVGVGAQSSTPPSRPTEPVAHAVAAYEPGLPRSVRERAGTGRHRG